jgi:hypothetical protein
MKSSGIKRGAALVAGTALALSGLAMTPAAADDVGQNEDVNFDFYTQDTGASTRFDGHNNTVSMLAGVSDALAGAAEVRFSYEKGATVVEIQEVPILNGVASLEWTPPGGAEGAAITDVRAEVLNAAEGVIAGPIVKPVESNTAPGMQDTDATDLDGALRSRVGEGPDGEVVISGTTTASEQDTLVHNAGPDGVGAEVDIDLDNWTPPDGQGVSTFQAIVPVDGTNDPSAGDDEIVISARTDDPGVFGNSDDANVYTMYTQVVTNAGVASDPAFPPTVQLGGADDESRYNITVTDQEGQPIQGLNVCEVATTAPNAACSGTGHGTPNNTETGVDGVATISMFESDIDDLFDRDGQTTLGGDPNNAHSTYYIVDVNQDGNYDDGIDYRFELVQSGIVPVATSVVITTDKGPVADDDELINGLITVNDQNGQPIANKSTVISGMIDCYDASGNVELSVPFGPIAANTNAAGQVPFIVPPQGAPCADGKYEVTLDAFANNNGTPQPDAGDAIAETYVLDVDTTHIEWENGDVAQALNGTTTVQTGTVVQDTDGDALGADRVIDIDYNAALNSEISDTQTPPTNKVDDANAVSETNAQGQFSVAITDPAVPDGQELNSLLTATAPGLQSGGDTSTGDIEIDFLRSLTPDRVRILNPITGDESDGLAPGLLGPDLRPGGLGVGEVEVENADGILLTDVDVELTIDEGHFVDITDTPFEPGAPGDLLDFVDDGQSFTVSTDDVGSALFVTNIERNAGFDDDGEVDDNMTAQSGPASDVHDLTWSTNNVPLNTGSFTVELSDDQESSILPQARAGDLAGVGQEVDYDVVTTDQFGNRTAQPTTVTDNTPIADFTSSGQSEFDLTQPALSAHSDGAVDQELEVELDGAIEVTYVDNPADSSFDPNNPGLGLTVDPVQMETTTDAINWYEVDYAASSYTLETDGPNSVPAQSAVTEILTATDQEGQPLENLVVDFLRGGPGNEDDDSCNEDVLNSCQLTDGNGEAFYDFVGGSLGTATITAVLYEPIVDGGTRITTVGPDTVQFVQNQLPINAKLRGKSAGKKDVLTVDAPSNANGAKVKLQKKVGGKWKQVGKSKTLNGLGNTTFKVADKNGKKATRYRAVVAGTVDTKGDTTKSVSLK